MQDTNVGLFLAIAEYRSGKFSKVQTSLLFHQNILIIMVHSKMTVIATHHKESAVAIGNQVFYPPKIHVTHRQQKKCADLVDYSLG